ncbi:MAG: hypothetical protein ACOCX2_08210 [Armatimonadota bacterium]
MHTRRHHICVRGDVLNDLRGSDRIIAAPILALLITALLVTVVSPPAAAQGPEGYGVPHLFALPTATTTRQFGMGGVTTSVQDVGFPNPAFAGMLEMSQGGVRLSRTEFDGGLELTSTQLWYATPIGEGQGIQLLGLRLDSDRGTIMTPAGGLPGAIEETDVAVHYGRRLSDRWLVGAGISPVLESETRLLNPVTGDVVSFSDSEATLGFRGGALYQHAEEGFVGLVFDWYTEDVTFQAPPMPAPQEFEFTSTEWALGASGRIGERLMGAIEWLELESEDGDFKAKAEGLHLGVEYEATEDVAVRAGSNDGGLTLGAGYTRDNWVVNYAYVRDWNDDSVGAAFGGSDTHQVEIGGYW